MADGRLPIRCPCGTGEDYAACCGPLHRGEASAPTAERLMRSRYSAFAVGDAAYLLRSWHPSTRPASVDLDDEIGWRRLEVLEVVAGREEDEEGIVEFVAHFWDGAVRERGELRERSTFARDAGAWTYVAQVA